MGLISVEPYPSTETKTEADGEGVRGGLAQPKRLVIAQEGNYQRDKTCFWRAAVAAGNLSWGLYPQGYAVTTQSNSYGFRSRREVQSAEVFGARYNSSEVGVVVHELGDS